MDRGREGARLGRDGSRAQESELHAGGGCASGSTWKGGGVGEATCIGDYRALQLRGSFSEHSNGVVDSFCAPLADAECE
eukprot:77843-Rhodomonas_salina.1